MSDISVTYSQLIALRAEKNAKLYCVETPTLYDLFITDAPITLTTRIIKFLADGVTKTSDCQSFEASVKANTNSPITQTEVRFYTHDYSDKSSWVNDTVGDYTSWVTGAAKYVSQTLTVTANAPTGYGPANAYTTSGWTDSNGNVLAWVDWISNPAYSGLNQWSGAVWKDASGNVLVRYDGRVSLPAASKSTNNTQTTIASCVHDWSVEPVAANYTLTVAAGTTTGTYKFTYNAVVVDNVTWANGGSVVLDGGAAGKLTLTMGLTAPVTPPQSDTVAVTTTANQTFTTPSSGGTKGEWIRVDGAAPAFPSNIKSSSKWRVTPPAGFKYQINEAWLASDRDTTANDTTYYRAYSYLPAGYAYTDSPAGVYKVKEWIYKSMKDFRGGANKITAEATTQANHSSPTVNIGFDYSKTEAQVLDGFALQYLEISLGSDKPFTGTTGATATFICMKYPSF